VLRPAGMPSAAEERSADLTAVGVRSTLRTA